MQNNTANAYREASILTADPGKLIVMCYEKAIQHLSLAVKHYENKEYEAKAKNLQKAIDIITELNSCLDFKKGGDVARNLDALYRYMLAALIDADMKRNPEGFCHIIAMLKELEEAWRAIIVQKPKPAIVEKIIPQSFSPRPAMAAACTGMGRAWSA
jgi:flagellar secretion chaperone FliS